MRLFELVVGGHGSRKQDERWSVKWSFWSCSGGCTKIGRNRRFLHIDRVVSCILPLDLEHFPIFRNFVEFQHYLCSRVGSSSACTHKHPQTNARRADQDYFMFRRRVHKMWRWNLLPRRLESIYLGSTFRRLCLLVLLRWKPFIMIIALIEREGWSRPSSNWPWSWWECTKCGDKIRWASK